MTTLSKRSLPGIAGRHPGASKGTSLYPMPISRMPVLPPTSGKYNRHEEASMDYQMAIDLIKAHIERYCGKEDEAAIKVLEVLLQDFTAWENVHQMMLKDKARYTYEQE